MPQTQTNWSVASLLLLSLRQTVTRHRNVKNVFLQPYRSVGEQLPPHACSLNLQIVFYRPPADCYERLPATTRHSGPVAIGRTEPACIASVIVVRRTESFERIF